MKLKTHELTEEIIGFSRLLQKNLKYYFNRSTYCFVNFNIDGKADLGLIQVFYSEESGFFSAKHQDKSVIRYAFGKYDKLNFQLAKEKSNPLEPLFIFDFPLDYSEKKYGAVFAKVNKQFHILSKVYKLSEKDIETLNYSYKVYPIEDKDYALFDFGSFKHPNKFFSYLEEVVNELDFTLSPSNKLFIKPYSIKFITKRDSDDSKYNYCMVCGHELESIINLNLLEFSRKFPARCESCLEKIYALNLYYKLDEIASSSQMVYLSDLKDLWNEEGLLGYNMKLLSKFEFLSPFHEDIYKLQSNEEIINLFSPLLKPVKESEEEDKDDEELKRLLGLDEDEKKCKYCGKTLDDEYEEDICSDCLHKQNAIPQIHKLLRYVKPGTAFTKSSIISKGLKSYDLDIICSYLVDLELLRDDMDDLLILESKSLLNEFIRKYSGDEEDLIPDDVKEVEKIKIKNSQLNEYTIDRAINLIDYIYYVEVTFIRDLYEWEVLFKRDGEDHFQVYDNPFEAKLAAIKYLEKLSIVEIVMDDDSPFNLDEAEEFSGSEEVESPDGEVSVPKTKVCLDCKEEYPGADFDFCGKCGGKLIPIEDFNMASIPKEDSEKVVKKCPICDSEVSNNNKTYCDECTQKYNTAQRKALVGIRNGTYNKKMAHEMQSLLDKGYTKTEVTKKYNIGSTVYIGPIIDYLLNDYDFPFELDSSKRCPICGSKVSRDTKTYCDECTEKYTSPERRALVGINQGLFTKKLAREMLDLKKQGKNNSFIAKEVKLPDCHTSAGTSLVNPIIKFLLIDEVGEENLILFKVIKDHSLEEIPVKQEPEVAETAVPSVKTCLVCGKEFAPKCSNGSDIYCPECKKKYTTNELYVHLGVKEGKYTNELANQFIELQNEGLTNKKIGGKFGINPALINPIIKYFEDKNEIEEVSHEESEIDKTIEEFNESNGVIIFKNDNQWYIYNEKELISIFYSKEEAYKFWSDYLSSINEDIYPHKDLFESFEKIILKGIISEEDYSKLFNLIPLLDCDLNKLVCNKLENDNYEIFIDFNLKDYDIPLTIRKLESLGWEKK